MNKVTCQNGGFVRKNCKCFCPVGLTGSYCEDIVVETNSQYLYIY